VCVDALIYFSLRRLGDPGAEQERYDGKQHQQNGDRRRDGNGDASGSFHIDLENRKRVAD
jgi:hypothetical protein